GAIADNYVRQQLPDDQSRATLTQVVATYPAMEVTAATPEAKADIHDAVAQAQTTLNSQSLMDKDSASRALRAAIKAAPESPAGKQASTLIRAADEHGSVMSFRWI